MQLLAAGQRQETPTRVRQAACWSRLKQVWLQHDEVVDQQVRWRDEPAESLEQRVVSPSDPEAGCSRKREGTWLGDSSAFHRDV